MWWHILIKWTLHVIFVDVPPFCLNQFIVKWSNDHAAVRWVRITGVQWWALGLWRWQPVLRLILVGVHPCSQGNCCGPSGGGFNHNSPHLHTLQYHKAHRAACSRLFRLLLHYQTFSFTLFNVVIATYNWGRKNNNKAAICGDVLNPHQKKNLTVSDLHKWLHCGVW